MRAGLFPPPVDLGPNSRGWTDKQLKDHDARLLETAEQNSARAREELEIQERGAEK